MRLMGEDLLNTLTKSEEVGALAQYTLAHHLFWKNRNTELALDLLENLVQELPQFTKAWACLGFVYNKVGNKEKAQQAFGECLALENNPEKIRFYKQQIAS